MTYRLQWVTSHLAVGSAPMSYADLDFARDQGIQAIVNLCVEFCDLHDIERSTGFQVYYLPTDDECAPDCGDLEKALEWVEDRIAKGEKVLVHCRFGIGRTGTFVTAYLMRSGWSLKEASKKTESAYSGPTSYRQRKFLKEYQDRCRISKSLPSEKKEN